MSFTCDLSFLISNSVLHIGNFMVYLVPRWSLNDLTLHYLYSISRPSVAYNRVTANFLVILAKLVITATLTCNPEVLEVGERK